jgi:hypothetical protein
MTVKMAMGAAISLFALALASAPASAHIRKYIAEPEITNVSGYNVSTGLYSYVAGDLESVKPACRQGRTISLYSSAGLVATTTTAFDYHGTWRIDTSPTVTVSHGNTYWVTVDKLILKHNRKHKHVCKAGASEPTPL